MESHRKRDSKMMNKRLVFVGGVITGTLFTIALTPQIEKIRNKNMRDSIKKRETSPVLSDAKRHTVYQELEIELERISKRVHELMS